jgi:hypothetical protein
MKARHQVLGRVEVCCDTVIDHVGTMQWTDHSWWAYGAISLYGRVKRPGTTGEDRYYAAGGEIRSDLSVHHVYWVGTVGQIISDHGVEKCMQIRGAHCSKPGGRTLDVSWTVLLW